MPLPQPVRRTTVGQAATTALMALSGALGLAAATAILWFVYGAAGFKPGPQPAARPPPPVQAAIPPVYAPAVAVMRPMPIPPQGRQASARHAADGQYYFDTVVSGMTVRMMFDTGASMVTLRAEDAGRAGIAVNGLSYNIKVQTANGATEAALVTLDSVRVGDITRWNVPAMVSRPGKLHVSLLGQSFMGKLAGYRFERGELILQGD